MLVPFSPKPGLNSDDTTFDGEGRWADGLNVRFWQGRPQVRGGVNALFSIATSNGVCRCILPFNRSGTTSIAYGMTKDINAVTGTAKLYVGSGTSTPSDRTPAGLAGTEKSWSLAPWGDTLLAVPEGGTLYTQSGAGTATSVAAAPDQITYMLATPQRQILALGCNEEVSTTFNGLCIRGCDLEDYSDWTSLPTNNAFEHVLEGSGSIVAGRMVGSYVAVWTNNNLHLGQYIGDPSQTYRFDPVEQDCGLIGPNAVVVVGGRAYWLSPTLRFHSWAPGEPVQTLPCPISKAFRDGVSNAYKRYIVASHNSRFSEVRFDFSGSDPFSSGYPTGIKICFYLAVSLIDGSWHKGNHAMGAILDNELIAALGGTTAIMGADESGDFWLMESGPLAPASSVINPFIKSAGQYLDNSQRRVMIRRFIPDFKDQAADLDLTLTVRDRPQSNPTTKGPYTFTTNATRQDFRVSGKIFTVKIGMGTGASSCYFRLGKPLFDVVPLGER